MHDRRIACYQPANSIKLMSLITFSFANPFAYGWKNVILVNKYVQHMYLFADLLCFMYVAGGRSCHAFYYFEPLMMVCFYEILRGKGLDGLLADHPLADRSIYGQHFSR